MNVAASEPGLKLNLASMPRHERSKVAQVSFICFEGVRTQFSVIGAMAKKPFWERELFTY
jgi:hypothetical protein